MPHLVTHQSRTSAALMLTAALKQVSLGFVGGLMFVGLAVGSGCQHQASKGGATKESSPTATAPRPGDSDCYKVEGASPCPPPTGDTSAGTLPSPGAVCTLSPCEVCGSKTAPAFRDSAGDPKPGWCICVDKSDGSGSKAYSCLTPDQWPTR
jgi:hypothetical protein